MPLYPIADDKPICDSCDQCERSVQRRPNGQHLCAKCAEPARPITKPSLADDLFTLGADLARAYLPHHTTE